MNIFCTKEIHKKVLEFNEKLEQICSINPQYFNKTDFTNNNSSIPVKVTFDDDNFHNMIILRLSKSTHRPTNKKTHECGA